MLIQPIKAESDWTSYVASSLLRRWAVLRQSGEATLPGLVELAAGLGTTSVVAVALGSVFRLTEACLGRPLNIDRCCTPIPGRDARAVIQMLDAQDKGVPLALGEFPLGLSSALASAVASARWLLSEHESQLHAPAFDHISSRAAAPTSPHRTAWR